ncbi:serine/threonine-protein kinase Nek3-like isoform X1 [Mytilus edulis]
MERSDKIKLEKLLGEGSFGIVYQITDIETNKKFALKRIDFGDQESEREQAKREADLLSNLRHDNILQYVESFEEDDSLFIVTEYCERGDLETYLEYKSQIQEQLPENKIAIWIYQIASGLHYLHERKILHRDLKTKNIFIMTDWNVRIGDLGIAKVLDLGQSKANSFVGTPAYMCPELFEQKAYNNRSDIWSLGCCVFEMMALKKAFEGKAIFKIIHNVISGKPPKLPQGYSTTLEDLTYAMLQKDDFLRPTAFYIMNHQYVQKNLLKTNAFDNFDEDYDQELAVRSKKKKVRSLGSSGDSGSGSGSSLTSWKNITNRIHEMEDDLRKLNEKKVHELVNSLELNKYRHLKKKTKNQKNASDTLVEKNEDGDEEDSGTFVYKGTLKSESDSDEEDQGTFVYHGTIKHLSDSDDEGTIMHPVNIQPNSNGVNPSPQKPKHSNTGKNLKEDLVAATLLNRRESPTEEHRGLSGEDLKNLLKKNPKDAAKQIVQGLKKTMSLDEEKSDGILQDIQKGEEKQLKKKKAGYLKKEARNRKNSDPGTSLSPDASYASAQAVRLYPRGEYVSYSPKGKDSDQDFSYLNDDRSHVPFERKVTTESLRGITAMLGDPNNKTIVMDQIAQLQRDIAKDIGEQQLSKCYDVMGQIEDDKIVQAALREVLGPKKYEEYKEQLFYLRMFEMSSAAKS